MDVRVLSVPVVVLCLAVPAGAAVYRCEGEGGGSFSARVHGESVTVKLPGREPVLLRVSPAASGAKYGDGPLVFWSKGERATVYLDGVPKYRDCLPGVEHPWRNRYVMWAAGLLLQLPEAWRDGEYVMRSAVGDDAARLRPGAAFVVTADYRAAEHPPAPLVTVVVYPSGVWQGMVDKPVHVLAATESQAFVLELNRDNPYPMGSADALRYGELFRDDTYWWGAFKLLSADEIKGGRRWGGE
jgi:hypothetical protein